MTQYILILVAFPFFMGFLLRYFLGNRGYGRSFTVIVGLLAAFSLLMVPFVGIQYAPNAVAAVSLLAGALLDAVIVWLHSK